VKLNRTKTILFPGEGLGSLDAPWMLPWCAGKGQGARANPCQPDKIPFPRECPAIDGKRGKVAFCLLDRVKVAKRKENALAGRFHAIAGQTKKSEEK